MKAKLYAGHEGTKLILEDGTSREVEIISEPKTSEAPMEAIKKFLTSNLDSVLPAESWFHEENFSLYLRTSKNAYKGRGLKAVSLTHINVYEEMRGQGIFTNFLAELEVMVKQAGYEALIVEAENSERMKTFLLRKGFEVKYIHDGINDFIKVLE
jgi:GNAT superfamily N-acetyltransferase